MDLMNKNLLMLKIDLAVNSGSFKQDPKLVAAIDKLFYNNTRKVLAETVLLPERKLDFTEVNQLLKQTPVENDKSSVSVIKDTSIIRKNVLRKIETLLGEINKSAEEGDIPKLIIRNQRLWSNCVYDLDRVTLKELEISKTTTIRYSRAEDKSRFNTIVFVLTRVHELMTKNMTVTRRELYYQNLARFRSQGVLDIGVRDVCCLLECPPWDLGIVATAKGLIAGPLKIVNEDGSVIDCSTSGGTLVPQDIRNIKEFKTSAKYILVVEKDAIFQKLLDEGALVRLRPVIILTGKGYPDVCTRQLLCRLVSDLKLKALALVDADPHGYEIFLTYKYGSLAQSHLSSSLACPKLLLLGARHQDVMTLAPKASRLALTALDKRKLVSLIARPYLNSTTGSHIKQELKAMLDSGVKAEIESLASSAAALCDSYLPSKIIHAEYLG
ncbi:meiotic recombination protein W68 [Zerene cesonia]|uniref:meiotic recombination protein W68 n=1 Tax=Zerene cesonia TaxID=33412 RepID=UPI0018E4F4D1|nr:meiotic recombination protein W68 [Zerene cesonia]